MHDLYSRLAQLKRPRLLTTAARHGAREYNRKVHLKRLLRAETLPGPGPAIIRLMELEEDMNTARRANNGTYRAGLHVEILAALMAEARSLRTPATLH